MVALRYAEGGSAQLLFQLLVSPLCHPHRERSVNAQWPGKVDLPSPTHLPLLHCLVRHAVGGIGGIRAPKGGEELLE